NFAADPGPILACHCSGPAGMNAFEEQAIEPVLRLGLLVLANQLAEVLAHGAVATLGDALLHEGAHGLRERDVHGGGSPAQALISAGSARSCAASARSSR